MAEPPKPISAPKFRQDGQPYSTQVRGPSQVMGYCPVTKRVYKGGNTAQGPGRRGYRGGRKSAYPPGTLITPFACKLSDADYAMALMLGFGSATRGVRNCLRAVASLLRELPTDRFAAIKLAKEKRSFAAAQATAAFDAVRALGPVQITGELLAAARARYKPHTRYVEKLTPLTEEERILAGDVSEETGGEADDLGFLADDDE